MNPCFACFFSCHHRQ